MILSLIDHLFNLSDSLFRSVPAVAKECYEFLYLVAAASEEGLTAFYERHGLTIIASDMSSFNDGMKFRRLANNLE